MKLAINKVSQRGFSEKLGTSSVTIDQFGCYLACLTMVENYYGFKVDILTLNNLLKEKGVYYDRNLIDLFKIDKVNEFVKGKEFINSLTTPAPLDKIDLELNEGRPVICQVDLNPNQPGPDHFILIIGKTDDGHYLAYDPWVKEEDAIFFDVRYGDPAKGIFGLRLITGPVPKPPEPPPDIAGLNQQIDTLKQQIDDITTALKVSPTEGFSGLTKRIVELLNTEKAYNDHLKQDETNLEKSKDHEGFEFKTKWAWKDWLIEFYREVKKV